MRRTEEGLNKGEGRDRDCDESKEVLLQQAQLGLSWENQNIRTPHFKVTKTPAGESQPRPG